MQRYLISTVVAALAVLFVVQLAEAQSSGGPVITSLVPAEGPVAGGTIVQINGSGFGVAASVSFGSTPVSTFTVTPNAITFVTPPATAGSVQVTVNVGAASSNGVPFTYVAPPVITALTPSVVPIAGNIPVTIAGTNLGGVTLVKFGALAASSFTVVSATSISAVAPSQWRQSGQAVQESRD